MSDVARSVVAGNLDRIRERVSDACAAADRDPADVSLVAVTKRIPLTRVADACRAGQLVLGENRIQDALPRQDELPPLLTRAGVPADEVRWHFVGSLQANKARKAVGAFELIHGVDSLKLAERLDRIAGERGLDQPFLFQVNVSGESQKHGLAPDEARAALVAAAGYAHARPQGLMTMARAGADEAELRRTFAALRDLAEALRAATGLPLPHLSMGMTGDFEAAIREGATLVRIGTAIFGPRQA